MEKIKLNNQIVSMRKYVKQAKVHVINKLVKQINLLQNRKGNEVKIQKAKRKAERYLEAVTIVKKIKPDDISKLALAKTKDWKGVLQDKNSSLQDRSTAMLANYGTVQKEVEAFYNANEELVLKISDYITEWEQKNNLPKNISKSNRISLEKKPNKEIQKANPKGKNLSSSIKEIAKTKNDSDTTKIDTGFKISHEDENINLESEDSGSNADYEYKTANIQKLNSHKNPIDNIEKIKDLHSDENNYVKAEKMNNSYEESDFDENDKEEEIICNSANNNNKTEKKRFSDVESNVNNIYNPVSKSDSSLEMNNHVKNKLKAIALLDLKELEGLEEIPITHAVRNDESDEKESSEDEINETFPNTSSDPFFLGHNKEDFNAKESDSSFNYSKVHIRTKDTAQSFNCRTENIKNSFLQRKDNRFIPQKNFQKSTCKQRDDEKTFKRGKFISQNYDNKFQEKNMSKNKKDFMLRNKQYSLIDTNGKKQFKNISRDYKSKDNIPLKNNFTHKKGSAIDTLHPSWEAKKKQKELLNTSFKGKRMVFND